MTEPKVFSNIEEVSIHKRRPPDEGLVTWAESLGQTTGRVLVVNKVDLEKSTGRSSIVLFAPTGRTYGTALEHDEIFLALSEPYVFHERVYWDALYQEQKGEVWALFKDSLKLVSP